MINKDKVWTWDEIQPDRTDRWIVAIDGKAYDVTDWASTHPGGPLVLQHHRGRDATDAVSAFHRPNARKMMGKYCIGRMEPNPVPPSTATLEYRKLAAAVEAAGLYKTSYAFYAGTLAWCALLLGAAWWLAGAGYVIPGALAVALFWQQVAFVGHDAGHHAIAHASRRVDEVLGLGVNAAVGIGLSWWNNTHNTHHCVVNSADCDPDIQFMPLVANSPLYFKSLFSKYHMDEMTFDAAARRLISIQHFTFLPLLCIARYGLYLQAFLHLLHGKPVYTRAGRWGELGVQLGFFLWYGTLVSTVPGGFLPRLVFVLVSHAAFMLLHLQICLSHFTCRVFEGLPPPGQSWLETQVWGTMNWSCPVWLDWLHGGLQFQIEHHLFPRLPRHNLRAVSLLVRPLCKQLGLPYHSPTFPGAIVELLSTLKQTAMQCRALPAIAQAQGSAKSSVVTR